MVYKSISEAEIILFKDAVVEKCYAEDEAVFKVILHLFDSESDRKYAETEKTGDEMQQSSSAGGVISTYIRQLVHKDPH